MGSTPRGERKEHGRGGRGLSCRAVGFLLLLGGILSAFVARQQMHEEVYMNYLDDVERIASTHPAGPCTKSKGLTPIP